MIPKVFQQGYVPGIKRLDPCPTGLWWGFKVSPSQSWEMGVRLGYVCHAIWQLDWGSKVLSLITFCDISDGLVEAKKDGNLCSCFPITFHIRSDCLFPEKPWVLSHLKGFLPWFSFHRWRILPGPSFSCCTNSQSDTEKSWINVARRRLGMVKVVRDGCHQGK